MHDPSVRLITLDLDDTVWPCVPVIQAAEEVFHDWLHRHAPRLAEAHDLASMRRHRRELMDAMPEIAHDLGQIRRRSLAVLLESFDYAVGLAEEALALFDEHRNRVEPFEDVAPVLRTLSARYRLVSLTNGTANPEATPLRGLFERSITAADAGAAKPHPALFIRALEHAAVRRRVPAPRRRSLDGCRRGAGGRDDRGLGQSLRADLAGRAGAARPDGDDPSSTPGLARRRAAARPEVSTHGFDLLANDGLARRGRLRFARGTVETPAFMPVGTYGTVKAMTPEELTDLGAEIVLGNTFHLMLRPGTEVIRRCGDLHDFMHWERPILTDSGGFQVFSLGELRKITEEGVHFRSPVDGSPVFLSPEISMQVQRELGSDIVMIFDECTPYPADEATGARLDGALAALGGTLARGPRRQPLGPLRHRPGRHARGAARRVLDGLMRSASTAMPIGGLSVGESEAERLRILDFLAISCPDRPRYLMGVGTPEDIVAAVGRGIDMFDCVMPTRNARNGDLFTHQGKGGSATPRIAPTRGRWIPVRLLHLPPLQPRLPAPPGQMQGDPRGASADHPQSPLLPDPDARTARGDRRWALRRLRRATSRRLAADRPDPRRAWRTRSKRVGPIHHARRGTRLAGDAATSSALCHNSAPSFP
jgi:queuine tRNA-ribosyltransferase